MASFSIMLSNINKQGECFPGFEIYFNQLVLLISLAFFL